MSRQMIVACAIVAIAGFSPVLLGGASTRPTTNEDQRPLFQLHLYRTTLLPYEPLMGFAVIHSPSDHRPITAIRGGSRYFLKIRYKLQDDRDWIPLETWWLSKASIMPGKQIIEPGKSAGYDFALYTFDHSGQPVFQSGKKYEIQAVMPLFYNDITLYSNKVLLSCSKIPAAEQAALDALAKNAKANIWKSLRFELLPIEMGSSNNHTDNLQRIEEYVKAYPASIYSLYLRRSYILYVKTTPGQHDGATDAQDAAYRAYLKQHAPWLPL